MIDYRKELGMDDLPGEVWADVAGYDGYYEVSNMGRVKSLQRTMLTHTNRTRSFYRTFKARIMKPSRTRGSNGKKAVTWSIGLCVDGVVNYFDVHILMARSFDLAGGDFVSHKDGLQLNNVLTNLEMVDPSEKARRTFTVGRGDRMIGVKSGAIYANSVPLTVQWPEGARDYRCVADAAREFKERGLSRAADTTNIISGIRHAMRAGRAFCGITITEQAQAA